MRIVHFSDWHGSFITLPPADLYICTGDMLPNNPSVLFEDYYGIEYTWNPSSGLPRPPGSPIRSVIDPEHERVFQSIWIENFMKRGGFDSLFGSPNSPVICVRGNHDFVEDFWKLFQPCRIGERSIIEIKDGVRIQSECAPWPFDYYEDKDRFSVTGIRGINFILGEWNDEIKPENQYDLIQKMPEDGADLIVTHSPPFGIFDKFYQQNVGMPGLRTYTDGLLYKDKRFLHCFGHVHEEGLLTQTVGDPVQAMFSNAATKYNVIDWEF